MGSNDNDAVAGSSFLIPEAKLDAKCLRELVCSNESL